MDESNELFNLADNLTLLGEICEKPDIKEIFQKKLNAIDQIAGSFSGSWLGYHSEVYYENFKSPPAEAIFSSEWGLKGESWLDLGSIGNWTKYDRETIRRQLARVSENADIDEIKGLASQAKSQFENFKSEIISILTSVDLVKSDSFLLKLKDDVEKCRWLSESNIISQYRPNGQIIARDSLAMSQGIVTPVHIIELAELLHLKTIFDACLELGNLTKKAASHIKRLSKKAKSQDMVGTNVFIGHGRSLLWRELKDFVNDRLSLPWDEFNRVPVAGVTNIARLSEMLESAAIAFLIMTAEDETSEGSYRARMNVIHEAGMFQGRLGFSKAIVLLEEGCEEFSNIQGLGQIRFPKGNIKAAFEEIRQVLEREGLVN